ncbi:MAG: PAS domain S-box protein [Stigonema ocellatum SAG 48.90 = DSM 106950]|nr:PAS domain S-box protein [Stigonema ocellatum SAG 48.90 = DSM 106950]
MNEITECKRTERELGAREELFQAMFNFAAVGVAQLSIDGKWLLVNEKLCDIVGYTKEDLLSRTVQDITHPDDIYAHLEYVRQMLAQEIQTYSMEKRYIRKDSSYVWINLTLSLVPQPEGEPKYFVATVEDISERKQAEVKLHEALKTEKELGELRARFVYMISHEFRNPLHIISFATSLLKRYSQEYTEEKKLKSLHRIQIAVEHLSKLMDDVLIIGRSEAGKLKFEPKTLDLEQFCRDLVAQFQQSYSSQHTVCFTSLGDCSRVYVDEKLLRPMLTNLLDNAIKYSPNNSTVDLRLSSRNGEVIFQIIDSGIGIPAADQKRLFEAFHRGNNVGDIPGTGLGLAVVKKLVDIHEGEISIASDVGVGTTFTIKLPSLMGL